MDDSGILNLYFARSEQAIQETDAKYGGYCYSIAYNILANQEDSEESVSDTYLSAWNSIPPRKPNPLAPFLGKIVRNISIDMWRRRGALKRGGGQMALALEELQECVASGENLEERYEQKELIGQVRKFVASLPELERRIFVCRYWYLESTPIMAIPAPIRLLVSIFFLYITNAINGTNTTFVAVRNAFFEGVVY